MDNYWLFRFFYAMGKKVEPTIGIEPMNLFLTKEALYRLSYVGITQQEKEQKRAGYRKSALKVNGAGDEARTRDIQLGRLKLYQLSYSRVRTRNI
jgi:hypothetical protein